MLRNAFRNLSVGSRLRSGEKSANFAAEAVSAGSEASGVAVPITTAAKLLRPVDMSRSKRRNIIRREKRMKRQIIRDVNNAKKLELRNLKFQVDPVLGDPTNEFIHRIRAELTEETNLANSYEQEELIKLLHGAEKAAITKNSILQNNSILFNSITDIEQKKKRAVLTILNMKNSNLQDKKKLAVKIAQREFQNKEGDTGSAEVQAAILTVRIHFLMDHIKANFKDKANIQCLRELVQQRQAMLKYLKRHNAEKYFYTIKKLGLTDDCIVREFNMDKNYMQEYNVWEDKVLVKLSEKEKSKAKRIDDLKKKVNQYRELAGVRAEELAKHEEYKATLRAQRAAERNTKGEA